MGKLRGPLFSLGASGRLARAYTMARRLSGPAWLLRGRPDNPNTPAQLTWRTMWQLAADLWHQLSPAEQAVWERLGTQRHMTGYAWYMSQALRPNPGIYLPLAGGTMSGDVDMDSHAITDLPDPAADQDAATKKYHDDNLPPGGYTEGCRVYHSVNYACATGVVWVEHPFDSEEWDTDNMHDTVLANTRLTFNTAGKYLIHFQLKWAANIVGRRIIAIQLNGVSLLAAQELAIPGNNTFNMNVTTISDRIVTDYVEAAMFQNSGANLDTLLDPGSTVSFMAQRIG